MEKLHQSIFINASPEKVWNTMLGKETYKEWTKAFDPTSRFEGDWSEGSKMLFIGNSEEGEMGMVSRIAENRPHEFISIEHLGILKDGIEDTESEDAKKWAPAFENYTFIAKDGGTELSVDQDMEAEMKEQFETMWKDAFARLKELAEA